MAKPYIEETGAEEILWRDRKRIMGMPLSFTVYEIDNDRLTMKKGLLRTETNEMLLYRILDVRLVRTFAQKLFGVGTVTLYSADQTHRALEIKNIKKPDAVRKFISRIVERERAAKGLTGRELYGIAGMVQNPAAAERVFADLDGDGIPD